MVQQRRSKKELDEYPRSELVRELSCMRPGELPMKTETPSYKVEPYSLMETVEFALNPKRNRKIRLSAFYREKVDIRMIGVNRKFRKELSAALVATGKSAVDEMQI